MNLEANAAKSSQQTHASIQHEAAKASRLAADLAQAQTATAEAEAAASQLRSTIRAVESERDAARDELTSLEARSEEAAVALEEGTGKGRQLEEVKNALERAKEGLEADVKVLEGKLESCQTAMEGCQKGQAESEARAEAAERKLAEVHLLEP